MPRMIASVTDKEGLAEFARALQDRFGFDLYASSGTKRALESAGLRVVEVSEYTGFPEILDDRLKTLHPKVHGGVLGLPQHQPQMDEHGILRMRMAVVNLYGFAKALEDRLPFAEIMEKIDVGGPALARAPCKNIGSCITVPSRHYYNDVLTDLVKFGRVGATLRRELAIATFEMTSKFDQLVARYLRENEEEVTAGIEALMAADKLEQ